MKKFLVAALLLMAAVWLLYAQTADFEFLRLDDHDYTFRCAFVKDGLSGANIAAAFANLRHAAIWMPITYVSYMADISAFGPGMGPHHLVNVAIHAINTLLLLGLILQLLRSRGMTLNRTAVLAAALATAFWSVHPQRVEAVAWIAGRKELLCTTFVLAGLLCWLRGWRAWAAVACALACMSKPTAMCFPFLVLAVEWMSRGDCPPAEGGCPRFSKRRWLPYLPLLAMSVATGALAVYSQTHAEGYAVRDLFSASLPWRLLNAVVALGLYVFQTLLPVGVHLDYRAVPGNFPLDGILGLSAFVAAVLAVAVTIFGFRPRRPSWPESSRRLAPPLFFLAAIVPTLGIFGSFGEHSRADRFLYLPAMAIAMALAQALVGLSARGSSKTHVYADATERVPPMSRPGEGRTPPRPGCDRLSRLAFVHWGGALSIVAGVVVVLVYWGCSIPVVASYRNDFTAFSRTLKQDPDHGRALAHVASEECARFGHIDRGISLFRRSQELRPRDDTAAQLAYTLALRGLSSDYDEIRRLCAKFACDHSRDLKGQALEALGVTAMRQRRWKEAIACLEDSIRAPRRFYSAEDARLRLGACYCNAGRSADAIRIFEPLTQSRRVDIAGRARQFLATVRRNPAAILLF